MNGVVKKIIGAQNSDGGWGYLHGRNSNTECTSLCLLALKSVDNDYRGVYLEKGLRWLVQRQHPEGSWPLSGPSNKASWSSSIAVIALAAFRGYEEQTARAVQWLLKQEGRTPGLLSRVTSALWYHQIPIGLDPYLVGWPWLPQTFSWVEPTSYALIALKKMRTVITNGTMDERIKQAELMIYDRMCVGGGWNYGNSRVLGETLWPYPDITALALIALQDHALVRANLDSLAALNSMLHETQSGLALSLGAICVSIYGEDPSEWCRQLEKVFKRSGFLGEIKPMALSVLAFSNDTESLRVKA